MQGKHIWLISPVQTVFLTRAQLPGLPAQQPEPQLPGESHGLSL